MAGGKVVHVITGCLVHECPTLYRPRSIALLGDEIRLYRIRASDLLPAAGG